MNAPKRLSLAHLPTPIHKLSRLSAEVGKNIFVWRDDMTGFTESGNKVRKLEYLLAEARSRNATRIISAGGSQSNHTRATAFPDTTGPLDRDDTAETTWQISIDAATLEAPAARQVMAILGHLAPDPLPITWLTDTADDPYLDTTPEAIGDALDALYGYSLVDLTRDAVTVHRVVQYAARRSAPADAAAAAIRLLRRQSPGDAPFRHPA